MRLFRAWTDQGSNPSFTMYDSVTLGKLSKINLLNLIKLQFPPMQNWDKNSSFLRGCGEDGMRLCLEMPGIITAQ